MPSLPCCRAALQPAPYRCHRAALQQARSGSVFKSQSDPNQRVPCQAGRGETLWPHLEAQARHREMAEQRLPRVRVALFRGLFSLPRTRWKDVLMSETFRTCLRHHQKIRTWLELLNSVSAEDRKTNRLQASKSGSSEECLLLLDHPSCGQHFRHPRASVGAAGCSWAGKSCGHSPLPHPNQGRAALWFA